MMGTGPLFRWWFRRQLRKPTTARTGDPLLDALAAAPAEPFRREGEWLVNRKYGCRLRTAGEIPASSLPLFRLPHEVFRFSVEGITVTALAIRPEKLRHSFTMRAGMTLLANESFFAGTHPARHLAWRVEEGGRTRFVQQWFVELEQVVFLFDAPSEELHRPEVANAIKAVVQTFELIPL
jgi:hypothetical protein